MFAFLVIAIELAILYLVFWVVFIREPNPREIRAELWGRYANSANEKSQQCAQATKNLLRNSASMISFWPRRLKTRLYRIARLPSHKTRHHRKKPCACHCHQSVSLVSHWQESPRFAENQQDLNRELAEKLLLILNRTLNKFSAKIPH